MKKLLFVAFMVFGIALGFSQTSLNDYKYIIVPTKYDFLREADKYQTNSLTKFLFNKYGFEAIMDNEEFPQDLASNRCLGLFSDVKKLKGLLKTKLQITLRDCNNKEVFKSQIGETREKEYEKAYNLALRDAFTSFEAINYVYTPNNAVLAQATTTPAVANSSEDNSTKEEIAALKKEIESLKKEKEETAVVVVEEKPKKEEVVEAKQEVKEVVQEASSNLLYAQPKGNGYQLVDNTPKVVMVLLKTPKEGVFLVKGQNAMVYQKDGLWHFAKDNNGEVVVELLPVKF